METGDRNDQPQKRFSPAKRFFRWIKDVHAPGELTCPFKPVGKTLAMQKSRGFQAFFGEAA
jgi:hypothetical protein